MIYYIKKNSKVNILNKKNNYIKILKIFIY